jgi:hypothetical protein
MNFLININFSLVFDGLDREVEPLGQQLPIRTRASSEAVCYRSVTNNYRCDYFDALIAKNFHLRRNRPQGVQEITDGL